MLSNWMVCVRARACLRERESFDGSLIHKSSLVFFFFGKFDFTLNLCEKKKILKKDF